MKLLPLIWKSIWRRKIRTIFTLLSVFIAFLLFGILMTVRLAFTFGVDIAGLDRLVIIHKVSLIMPLPLSYQAKLEAVPGVEVVAHSSWFDGIYQDPSNFFAQMAVDPEPFFRIYPEFTVPPDQMKAWLADRQGAIVGRGPGEAIRVEGRRPDPDPGHDLPAEGGQGLGLQPRGPLRRRPEADKTQFFFRYDYLQENSAIFKGLVGWYIVKIADASKSVQMARTFDEMFANSSAETKTTTEKGFVGGLRQAGRRHRHHHDGHPDRGDVHAAAGRGQHDGAVGARAHERARRAEDAGIPGRHDSAAGPGRVALHRPSGRRTRPRPGLGAGAGRRSRRTACCRSSSCRCGTWRWAWR